MRRTAIKRTKRLSPRSTAKLAAVDSERDVRMRVLARDGRCRLEGIPGAGPCAGGPTFHHRRKASQGGGYTEANGARLCCLHNGRLESDADLAALGRAMGLVLRAGDPCDPLPAWW